MRRIFVVGPRKRTVNWCVNWYRKVEKLDSVGVRGMANYPEKGLDSEAISCGTVNITSKWGIMENVGGNRVTGFHSLLADVWEVCLAAFSSDITEWLFSRLSSSKVFLQERKSISPFHTLYKGRRRWACSLFSSFSLFLLFWCIPDFCESQLTLSRYRIDF